MLSTPNKPKVLVVDDEPSILSSIADLLESEFDVMTETDPERGLEDLKSHDISVLISDQRMPSMNGDEFLKAAREKSSATRVLLTGFADIQALGRVVNDGKIYAYVTKPWDPLNLRTTVRNAAREYKLLDALRHERDLLRTLVNNIPDCIYVQDAQQRYRLVNQAFAEMAGLADGSEAIGKQERECLAGEFGRRAAADGRLILETGEPIIEKYDEWIRRDGTARWYASTRVPVRSPVDGTIEALVGVSRDITEQKETENHLRMAQEAAEQTMRAKQEFLARTSHEIRTPLNSILGMGELLNTTDLSQLQQKYVGIFRNNSQTLVRLLNDLLDLSRGDLRELKLEAAEFDLREVVAGAVETLEKDAHAKGLAVRLECEEDVPARLKGDAARLKQVLTNLVNNALKFTQHGEVRVKVRTAWKDERTALMEWAVIDSGIGIAADKLLYVFEAFNQVEEFATSPYGGSGLGLTICRQIVQQMGGRIWVESMPGVGSTFRFTARFDIPESKSEGSDVKPMPVTLSAGSSAAIRILLAEDNEDNVFLIEAYMDKAEIEVAGNGREAVEKFMAGHFDIVLMDLQMPEMDGLQATRLIREWEQSKQLKATPILACTAHSSAEQSSLDAGCSGHLIKPISKRALVNAIADCLGE